jgi:hypothetical protein
MTSSKNNQPARLDGVTKVIHSWPPHLRGRRRVSAMARLDRRLQQFHTQHEGHRARLALAMRRVELLGTRLRTRAKR